MSLKESLREHLKPIVGSIATGLIVVFIVAILPGLCPIFCSQKATIEGVITQNDKPVNNVNIIINGHKNLTGGDGKFVISDIQLEPGLKLNIDLPSLPPIAFDSDHYVDIEPENMFQRELDDDKFREISIHFKLTEEEANKDLRLFLDTLDGTHEWDGKNVPHFKMKVKIRPIEDEWSDLGEYTFGDSPNVCEKQIRIDNRFIDSGENIILFENANPEGEGYWVFFDSLKLDVIRGDNIWALGINDDFPDEFFNPWKLNCMHEW